MTKQNVIFVQRGFRAVANFDISYSEVKDDNGTFSMNTGIKLISISYPALTKSKQPRIVRVVRKYKAGDL